MIKRRLDTFMFVECPRIKKEFPRLGEMINAEECENDCSHLVEEECDTETIICSYPTDLDVEWLEGVLPLG